MRLFCKTTRGDRSGIFANNATALGLRIGQETAAPASSPRSG
jgi:hypothetical protein